MLPTSARADATELSPRTACCTPVRAAANIPATRSSTRPHRVPSVLDTLSRSQRARARRSPPRSRSLRATSDEIDGRITRARGGRGDPRPVRLNVATLPLAPDAPAGAFLRRRRVPVGGRWIVCWPAYRLAGGRLDDAVRASWLPAIRAAELHRDSFETTALQVACAPDRARRAPADAGDLCRQWLLCDDSLLGGLPGEFEFVVGNLPYVRQECIPDERCCANTARA